MNKLTNGMMVLTVALATTSFTNTDSGLDYGNATITSDYCVSLDTSEPIHEFYEMDISHLSLLTDKDAGDKFGYICNNLLTYTFDLSQNKAYLQVHLDRTTAPKDVVWWNDYVNSLCGL